MTERKRRWGGATAEEGRYGRCHPLGACARRCLDCRNKYPASRFYGTVLISCGTCAGGPLSYARWQTTHETDTAELAIVGPSGARPGRPATTFARSDLGVARRGTHGRLVARQLARAAVEARAMARVGGGGVRGRWCGVGFRAGAQSLQTRRVDAAVSAGSGDLGWPPTGPRAGTRAWLPGEFRELRISPRGWGTSPPRARVLP